MVTTKDNQNNMNSDDLIRDFKEVGLTVPDGLDNDIFEAQRVLMEKRRDLGLNRVKRKQSSLCQPVESAGRTTDENINKDSGDLAAILSRCLQKAASQEEAAPEVKATGCLKENSSYKTLSYRCKLPRLLCLVSPFFPVSRIKLSKDFSGEGITISNPWGEIYYKGQQLTIGHEDLLLAILALIKIDPRYADYNHNNIYFRGRKSSILNILGLSDGAGNYERLEQMLKDLQTGLIKVNKVNNKKMEQAESSPLIRVNVQENGVLAVFPHPLFFDNSTKHQSIDFKFRMSLKSRISKALYRFVVSHKFKNIPFKLATISHAVNLDPQMSVKEQRLCIKAAIDELKEAKKLSQNTRIDERNLVWFN